MMLDHFADRDSPVHRLDPVAKTLAMLAVVLAAALVARDRFLVFLPLAVALAAYHALGRVPVGYALRRLVIVSPFAVAIAALFPFFDRGPSAVEVAVGPWTVRMSEAGLVRAGNLLVKFLLCFWATLLLLSTTRFQDVVQALARLRVPRAFVVQLAFLYRYLWVLIDEVMHIRRARDARDAGAGPWPVRFRSHTGLVGVLFLRTYDRAERIYWAMAARGFDGTLHSVTRGRMAARDWLFLAGVLLGCAGMLVADRMVHG